MSDPEMLFVERVFNAIDDLECGIVNLGQASSYIGALIAECGYEYFTITRLPQPKIRLGPAMLIKHWSDEWLTHYDRSGYYKHDPVVRHCFETMEPFVWADVYYGDDDRSGRVMDEAAEHGYRHGFCVPMQGFLGLQAVASYAGHAPELTSKRRKALHLLSIAAYGWAERTERVRRHVERVALSPREKDVLIWTALGRTNAEVAERLDVSVMTIRTHLERARSKLGALNTVHTVVEALRRREIKI